MIYKRKKREKIEVFALLFQKLDENPFLLYTNKHGDDKFDK